MRLPVDRWLAVHPPSAVPLLHHKTSEVSEASEVYCLRCEEKRPRENPLEALSLSRAVPRTAYLRLATGRRFRLRRPDCICASQHPGNGLGQQPG